MLCQAADEDRHFGLWWILLIAKLSNPALFIKQAKNNTLGQRVWQFWLCLIEPRLMFPAELGFTLQQYLCSQNWWSECNNVMTRTGSQLLYDGYLISSYLCLKFKSIFKPRQHVCTVTPLCISCSCFATGLGDYYKVLVLRGGCEDS